MIKVVNADTQAFFNEQTTNNILESANLKL
jgi:hypothetical protein